MRKEITKAFGGDSEELPDQSAERTVWSRTNTDAATEDKVFLNITPGRVRPKLRAASTSVSWLGLVDDVGDDPTHQIAFLVRAAMADVGDHPVGSDRKGDRLSRGDEDSRQHFLCRRYGSGRRHGYLPS